MATNLEIDDALLNRALKVGEFRSKKDAVNHALAEYIRRHEQQAIIGSFGVVEMVPGCDHKELRAKR